MPNNRNPFVVELPRLTVSSEEYAILEELAIQHECTVPQLLMELITPSGDKAGRWLVIQIDETAYQAFQAVYDNDEGHHAEDMIEDCVNSEGERLKKTRQGK